MTRPWVLVVLMAIVLPQSIFADDAGSPYIEPFWESFEGAFPPSGWSIESGDYGGTWCHVMRAMEGNLQPDDGNFFAFVPGSVDEKTDARLVSPPINLFDLGCGSYPSLSAGVAYDDETIGDKFQIEVRPEYGIAHPVWKTIWSSAGSTSGQSPSDWEMNWNEISVDLDPAGKIFTLAFHYTGRGDPGVGLDGINISCLIGDGGFTQEVPSPHDKIIGSGCSTGGSADPASIIISIFMFAIGLVGIFLGRRKS